MQHVETNQRSVMPSAARILLVMGSAATVWHGDDKVDYIVDDEGTVAFVFGSVSANSGAGIPNAAIDRKGFERLAAAYFAEHPELADCAVRADQASILVVSDSRAIIRHHVNALGVCGLDLRP